MIIPIPANNKQFIIKLSLTASFPIVLGMVLYDPGKPFSDYLRRKVTFRASNFKKNGKAHRKIQIRVPVSPQNLTLEVYNKNSRSESGFKVDITEIANMPPAEIWASPERHRYMSFAIDFAQKAGYVKPGFYDSPNHEFLIQYLTNITDPFGNQLVTPARVHRQMPRVQVSMHFFKKFTIPVRVAILAHEGCHYFLNTRSEETADLCGIDYYYDYGFPRVEASYALTKVFNQHPESVGEPHYRRVANVMNHLDKRIAEDKSKAIA